MIDYPDDVHIFFTFLLAHSFQLISIHKIIVVAWGVSTDLVVDVFAPPCYLSLLQSSL